MSASSYFSDLDAAEFPQEGQKTGYFSDLREEPSAIRSALSAPFRGILKEASNINPFSPRGPVSPELGQKILDQFLPIRPEHNVLERAGKLGTYAALGPEGLTQKAIQTAGGTLLGEAAEKAGYGDIVQNILEVLGMGAPGLIKSGIQKSSQLVKGLAGKMGGTAIETPTGRTGYELAEEALKGLEKPSTQQDIKRIELPKIDTEATKPLTGRAKILDKSIGSEISSEKFFNEKHGGINISGNVKSEAKLERAPFERKYKLAEQEFKGKSDIYPRLAEENDALIARLEEIPERNAGEEAVYKKAQALKKMIGEKNFLKEAPLSSLLKYSDSISGIANFDMPYVGPKGLLKSMAKSLNNAVIESAKLQGLNTKHMLEADALYSKWADKFLNDEISQFLSHKIRNPESLYRKALSDEGVYRALKEAIGKKHPKSMDKLERGIVEVVIKPYVKDSKKIGTPEFGNDMANLEGLIGKPKATKVKNSLSKSQIRPIGEKITGEKTLKGKTEKGFLGETPEAIERMMESRSGIKELRKELKARGREDLFDQLAQEKTIDIMRGGVVSPEKIKGIDMFNQVRNKHNYDILSEIYGKKSVDALLSDLYKINKRRVSFEKMVRLGKLAGLGMGAAKLIKAISIFI